MWYSLYFFFLFHPLFQLLYPLLSIIHTLGRSFVESKICHYILVHKPRADPKWYNFRKTKITRSFTSFAPFTVARRVCARARSQCSCHGTVKSLKHSFCCYNFWNMQIWSWINRPKNIMSITINSITFGRYVAHSIVGVRIHMQMYVLRMRFLPFSQMFNPPFDNAIKANGQ